MNRPFELLLFYSDLQMVKEAVKAGVDGVIIDWEYKDKETRQNGFNTQINRHTVEDLQNLSSSVDIPVICRINPVYEGTKKEIELAIESGASEILLPMVRRKEEVEAVLDWTKGKTKVGILIETRDSVCIAAELSALPLSRVYVGLNDLSIENQERNLFLPLANGLLQTLRSNVSKAFGFGGLTLPNLGFPIPCQCLIDEMIRLNCHFSFLRRSFIHDTGGKNFISAISSIREAIQKSFDQTENQRIASHQKLLAAIEKAGACF